MFTTYQYKASASADEILADITLLLTGPGVDKVLDGDFGEAGLADWTLGAGWADGTGKAAKNSDGTGTLTQAVSIPAVSGKKYRITYTVLDYSVGGVTVTYGGQSDSEQTANTTARTFDVIASSTDSLVITPSGTSTRLSIDDVKVQPLSGIVDKTLLGASCTQAGTTITATVVADWEIYDQTCGSTPQTIFRSLNQDGTTWKYMMVDLATAGYVSIQVGESWSTSGNSWTNLCSGSDTDLINSQVISISAGGVIFIGASIKYAIFFSKNAAGTSYGGTTPGFGPCGIFERTRAAGWDTAGAGYPPYVYVNWYLLGANTGATSTLNAFAPRLKGLSADVLTTNAYLCPTVEFVTLAAATFRAAIPTVRCIGSDGVSLKHFMHEIGLTNTAQALKAGKILDIYLTTESYGSVEETVSYNGYTYFIMTEFSAAGTAAGMRIAVPKF